VATESRPTLAVIGGTGHEGAGLAARWACAGYPVVIGSRSEEKAAAAAYEMRARIAGEASVIGLENRAAAEAAVVLVLTVPYAAHAATLESIRSAARGKVLIDVTVPLVPPKVSRVQLPAGGSAALEAQSLLGAGARVVSAFQNISAVHLQDLDHAIDCDVLVTGDDREAKQVAIQLAAAAGMRAWDAGPLANAVVAEGLTSVLIGLNQRYKSKSAGIRITGLEA
jgi:8-hydroxy-5-deazaflavin:NADPH oxidoreductase